LLAIISLPAVAQSTDRKDSTDKKDATGKTVSKDSVRTLKTVTVTASRPLIERQIDKTVVNVAQSITSEGSTVLELMQKLPGVQMGSDGQITMNGKGGVNVYIDGKPSYLSSGDLASLLGGMPASNIQKIEIMSNPSSKYDAAGTGGIINIVRKKNRKEGWNGSVNGSFGQAFYERYNGGFTLSYKNEKYNLFINNSYTFSKSLFNRTVDSHILNADNSPLTEQVSGNDAISTGRNYRPTIGLDLYLSRRTTLTFSGTAGFGSSDNRTLSGMDILDSAGNKINRLDFTSGLKDHPINYSASLQLTHQLDTAGKTFTIDLDHADYRNYPTQGNQSVLNDPHDNFISETDVLLVQRRKLDIYAAAASYTRPLNNKGSLEMGIKSSYVDAHNDNTYYDQAGGQNIIDAAQSDYSINSENINAAYLNLSSNWRKLVIQAGLRAERTITRGRQILTDQHLGQDYTQLFPTLFFDYPVNDNYGLNMRLGRRTERAAYSEMVPFRRPQTATLFFQGNPDLRPQTSWHGELTWSLRKVFSITLNYDVYRDYIRTLPFLDSNKVTITRRPVNIQGAHSWDIDLAYSKKLTSWWSTDNTLSLYQNSFSGQAGGFSLNNPGLASIYLSMNNSFTIDPKLSAECNFEYNSKRQFVTSTFGPYSILSFGIRRQLFHNKGSLSANAHNIFQSEGHNAIDRNLGLYQYSNWNFYTRSVSMNLTYRFGSGKTGKVQVNSASTDEQNRAGN